MISALSSRAERVISFDQHRSPSVPPQGGGFSVMSYDRLRRVMSAPRVFSRAPSTLSGVEGGVRGFGGNGICAAKGVPRRELVSGGGSRRGRLKQITFRAAVKKSNRALHGADFLGTANRKLRGSPPRTCERWGFPIEGWGSPGVEVEEHDRSRYGLHQSVPFRVDHRSLEFRIQTCFVPLYSFFIHHFEF